jgi:rod shape-determining protein MreD
MAMRREYLLAPANRAFITFTIVVAFIANVLPWGKMMLTPDFLALTLVFWNVRQPRMVGIGIAFLFGLLMDVHDAALLGQHALVYSLLSYGAISLHRRIPWFGMPAQMAHVLPLLLAGQFVSLVLRMMLGGGFPGWLYFLPSITGTLLWPIAEWLLLAPQRVAVEHDENRPL